MLEGPSHLLIAAGGFAVSACALCLWENWKVLVGQCSVLSLSKQKNKKRQPSLQAHPKYIQRQGI